MMKNSFAKLVCGGNDFIIIDHRHSPLPVIKTERIAGLCHRSNGIGADGVIYLVEDAEHPFAIKLYNADGSAAEVSYNGSRCLALYANENQIAPKNFTFASDAGLIAVEVAGKEVLLHVPPPRLIEENLALELEAGELKAHFIEAGVPYLVLFTDEVDPERAVAASTALKTHPNFPAGTNVAVAEPPVGARLKARFFERGVDEETDSSGTGCVAVALLAQRRYGLGSPIVVVSKGGDFAIKFAQKNDNYSAISTAGLVDYLFDGVIKA
jgi:diaminopimelate epimerase